MQQRPLSLLSELLYPVQSSLHRRHQHSHRCWPFFKYFSTHRHQPFCFQSVKRTSSAPDTQILMELMMVMIPHNLSGILRRLKHDGFFSNYFFSRIIGSNISRQKKERKYHHVVLVWHFAPPVSNQEQEGHTGGRCYLLATVKKRREIPHVELREPTLDKWIWHVGPCRARPCNLLKIWIKLTKANFWALFDCGSLESFVTSQKKKKKFLGAMECVQKMCPAVVVFILYSASSAFNYQQLL